MKEYPIPAQLKLCSIRCPKWKHYEPFKWWLLPHGVAGACALLLGPMQFSERLRYRFRKLHRVLGRIYAAGVFIAAPLGIYIQHFQERLGGSRSFAATVKDRDPPRRSSKY